MSSVTIYGAGISGLVAAINLAKEGYEVTVFEKEDRIGGSKKCTPSVHMTPFHFQKMNEYIEINVEPCFSKLDLFKAYIYNKIVIFNHSKLYVTERGPNQSSLDYYLYKKALKQGVSFEFSHPLTPELLLKISDGSIIATGGYSCLCKDLHIYHVPFVHYDSTKKINNTNNHCFAFFNSYLTAYGYVASKEGMISTQVGFRLNKPHRILVERFKKQIKDTENFEFENWTLVHDNFPARTYNLKKVHGKTIILAGTLSGFLDPFFGFGVNSALISGKIAALTALSKKKGVQEYKKFTEKLNRMFLLSRFYDFLPLREMIIPRLFNNAKKGLPLIKQNFENIPGFIQEDSFQILEVLDEDNIN
ncbi:MAG: NAD(P)-binding protein [Candidatus Thermoplasmatota archaeon]|nr:NAD(P)-binding protein [Candidatus Thermoplasmatota archaeon]